MLEQYPPSPFPPLNSPFFRYLILSLFIYAIYAAQLTPSPSPYPRLYRSPHPAAATVRTHIQLLHAYNETRDLATGLMGILADNRGVRACDVHAEFDVQDEAS